MSRTRRPNGRRKGSVIDQIPRFIIITDTKRTEQIYFEGYRGQRFIPEIISEVPVKRMLERAELIKQGKRQTKSFNPNKGDRIWLVLDKDNLEESMIEEMFESATKSDIRIALSRPCFELWFLLHFNFDTTNYTSCTDLISKVDGLMVKEMGKRYDKKDDHYQNFILLRDNAIENCNRLQRIRETESDNAGTMSCTGVHEVVQELIDLTDAY